MTRLNHGYSHLNPPGQKVRPHWEAGSDDAAKSVGRANLSMGIVKELFADEEERARRLRVPPEFDGQEQDKHVYAPRKPIDRAKIFDDAEHLEAMDAKARKETDSWTKVREEYENRILPSANEDWEFDLFDNADAAPMVLDISSEEDSNAPDEEDWLMQDLKADAAYMSHCDGYMPASAAVPAVLRSSPSSSVDDLPSFDIGHDESMELDDSSRAFSLPGSSGSSTAVSTTASPYQPFFPKPGPHINAQLKAAIGETLTVNTGSDVDPLSASTAAFSPLPTPDEASIPSLMDEDSGFISAFPSSDSAQSVLFHSSRSVSQRTHIRSSLSHVPILGSPEKGKLAGRRSVGAHHRAHEDAE